MREVRKQKGRFLKRLVSIVAVMVLCITGIDLSAFGVVSAEGNSGYKLEVEYSADSTSAVIKGKTDTVGQNIGLLQVTDGNGQVYDANNFEYPVTENGEYSFTLTYNETVDGNTTEKQQSLKAQVSNIVTIEPESETAETATDTSGAVQLNEVAEETQDETAATAATEAEAAAETESTEATTVTEVESAANEIEAQAEAGDGKTEEATVDGFPETLPLETLKANAANLMSANSGLNGVSLLAESGPTIAVTAVTRENQKVLTEVGTNGTFMFGGGVFSEDSVSIKTANQQRTFYRALCVASSGAQYEINALYPYKNNATGQVEWYYSLLTTGDGGGTVVDENGIELGFLVPDGSVIWAEYGLDENAPNYTISVKGPNFTGVDNSGYWSVSAPKQAKHKEKVVFEFNVPAAYEGATINIKGADGSVSKSFSTKNGSLTSVDEDLRRYSGVFDMLSQNVTIEITPIQYTDLNTRYYGFGVDGNDLSALKNFAEMSFISVDMSWTSSTASGSGKNASCTWEGSWERRFMGVGKETPTYTSGTGISTTKKNYYGMNGGSTSQNVAWGEFNINDDVVINASYAVYTKSTDGSSTGSSKRPVNLRIDTYPDTISGNVEVSEIVGLPSKVNGTVTQTLSCGAQVIIKCTKFNGAGSFTTASSSYTKSDTAYYDYTITIKNMPYAFKTYINAESTEQQAVNVDLDTTGIIAGSGSCGAASKTANENMAEFLAKQTNTTLTGSFWVGNKTSSTGERYVYPLEETVSLWNKNTVSADLKNKSNGYYEFYIKVKDGYSRPTFTVSSGKMTYVGVRNGYFYYTYQAASPYPADIEMSSEPINLNIEYKDGKGKVLYTEPSGIAPAQHAEYVLKNIVLDSPNQSKEYFQGWGIDYVANGNQASVVDKIYSSGDLINLQEIYEALQNKGVITNATEYSIIIKGVWGDRQVGSLVPATYNITTQTGIKKSDGTGFGVNSTDSDVPENVAGLSNRYTDDCFERKPYTEFDGFYGTNARLTGYSVLKTDKQTGKTYMLSPESFPEGEIGDEGTSFAELVYMYAVNVQFATDGTYGSGSSFSNISNVNNSLSGTYYTPAKGYQFEGRMAWAFPLFNDGDEKTDPLSTYNPGVRQGKIFVGWKVRTNSGTSWIIDGESKKWLNIYDLATTAPDLWAEVVNTGTIVLEPVWEDDMGKITAQGSAELVQTEPVNHTVTTGEEYSISNTFSYTGRWDTTGFSYALRKANGSGYDVWYSYFNGTVGAKKDGVTASVSNDDKAKTVTVTIKIPANLVSKANLQGQTLSLSAWNSVNGVTDTNMATSGLGMAAKVNNVFTTSPRAITLAGQTTEVITTPERMGYEISAKFNYDSLYYTEEDIRATVSGLSYAVYYKTKDGTAEKKWWKEDGQGSGTAGSGPGVTYLAPTIENGVVTLKFWVGDIGDWSKPEADRKNSGSVDMKHDNSHYYIACWNTINGDYTIDQALEQIKLGSASKVPYTDVTTRVTWRDPDFYVNIPSTITLEDGNGKSNDYAGKKVSISFSSDTSSDASAENGQYRVPNINVAVQGKITLTSADSGETREVLVCGADGTEITQVNGNYNIDTLAYNKRSIVAWLNTPKGSKRGEKWTGTATFKFTNTSIYPETSTVSENTDVAINTDL